MFRMTGRVNPSGWRKVNKLNTNRIIIKFERRLNRELERAKKDMSRELSRIYSTEQEIQTLTTGFAGPDSSFSGGRIGTGDEGRFIKSSFTPFWQIIAEQDIHTRRRKNKVSGYFGRVSEINKKSEFKYSRSSGEVYTAKPFHGLYLQSIDKGGVWNVRPRMDNKKRILYPQEGVIVKSMIKEIEPRSFIKRAEMRSRVRIRGSIKNAVRKTIVGG